MIMYTFDSTAVLFMRGSNICTSKILIFLSDVYAEHKKAITKGNNF